MPIETKTFEARISDLELTTKNPRQINKSSFAALKKSLRDFPEMESIREIIVDEDMRVLGGHQRIKALEEMGQNKVLVKQVIGLTPEQKDEFIIKDNVSSGEWDLDLLTTEWEFPDLIDWGLDEKWLSKYSDFNDKIDEEGIGNIKAYESVLRFANKEVPLTASEESGLKDLLDRYVSENQVAFGFVDWIIKKCSE